MIAAYDLYLDADQAKVVPVGPDAAFLLVRAGKDVPATWVDDVNKLETPKRKPAVKKAPVKRAKKPVDKRAKGGGDK